MIAISQNSIKLLSLAFLAMYLLCQFDYANCNISRFSASSCFSNNQLWWHFFQNDVKVLHRQNICRPGLSIGCLYILKQGSKVKFIIWKRFSGHDFIPISCFHIANSQNNDKGDIRPLK